jgi:hypothetical protein
MSECDGTEPVAEDEILYRRVPVSMGWCSETDVSPNAFDPRDDETTGISIYRAKYKSIEAAAKGRSKRGYFIVVFRASDLLRAGIRIEPRPLLDDIGHAELPQLTSQTRDSDEAKSFMVKLATMLWARIEGPFVSPAE